MTESGRTPCNLPSEKVFSIQIGSELFRLSGASIASDAPSYFSQFFEEQLCTPDASKIRTLYIDRDPATFHEIARHLQGYHVRPRDGAQFVKLFADAQFYTRQCFSSCGGPNTLLTNGSAPIDVPTIGDRHFQIPRDIFNSPGDSPNFFSLGFGAFFASPSEVFPGLDRVGLLRPPAIVPPAVPNRSADVFSELLHLLRGYPLQIRNEIHRAELLRDCRYFHLRGLEQKLIPHQIAVNPFSQRSEIIIRLEDVRPSGIQSTQDAASPFVGGSIMYTRPFVDDDPADLILEVGDESTLVHCASQRANFVGLAKSRMASLLQVGGLPVKIRLERETDLTIDGESDVQRTGIEPEPEVSDAPPAKRPRSEGSKNGPWIVRTGQWRLHVQPSGNGAYEAILIAVKLDVYTTPRVRNQARNFL
ncbi:hypothetical protein N7526_000034 [Penicillium atrosanguineum]|nr:hypothetical protein N7526_000034 [Penicillium atrosanguineum]